MITKTNIAPVPRYPLFFFYLERERERESYIAYREPPGEPGSTGAYYLNSKGARNG